MVQTEGQPWQLNLDVLLLIAEYAHPHDLLCFARTCKRFQELLMDRSSMLVWKTTRRKFKGLPKCPTDLTEVEYTALAFCARCYACGKYASTVFWEMRRRYCLDCRDERLCRLPLCHEIIQNKYVLGMEHLTIGNETPLWVDKEQMKLLMEEYERSYDKNQLISDRQEQLVAIRKHARQCEKWQRKIQTPLLQERDRSIFERLKQLGYERDVAFSGRPAIRESRKSLFNTTKLLTDQEWDRIWPEWLETMNTFRLQRLERTVYQSRRRLLAPEYDSYVMRSSHNTPSFDLLPHVADIARFLPFRDIIRAPEETDVEGKVFESAFAQLPQLINEWKKRLDAEVAELVKIPSDLSLKDSDGRGQDMSLSNTTSTELSQTPTDKLRLACALFKGGSSGFFTYPEVFSTSMSDYRYPKEREDDSERAGSIQDRFGIRYVEEAPYVVHACGLDPNVATAEDMDRRNARLKCLSGSCRGEYSRFYNWREALWHVCSGHWNTQPELQLVGDDSEEMAKIKATEKNDDVISYYAPYSSRCLLCLPRVGDGNRHNMVTYHLTSQHSIQRWNIKEGVHYLPLAKFEHRFVEKVKTRREEGFTFKVNRERIW